MAREELSGRAVDDNQLDPGGQAAQITGQLAECPVVAQRIGST
jgi:hypothetical protein